MSKGKNDARSKSSGTTEVSPDELVSMIANKAYLKAEERGFQNGSAEQDWLEAEKEIGGMFKARGTRERKARDCAQKERRRKRHNQLAG